MELKHPNIVQLITTFSDEEKLYFVFEHCENKTMDDLIKICNKRMGGELIKIYLAQFINVLEFMQ